MKLYFAGAYNMGNGLNEVDGLRAVGVHHKLFSYYHEPKSAAMWGPGLMLDSGAFSAFTVGAKIDIDQFLGFVSQVKPDNTIQLDVIGDEDATWRNWKYSESRGVSTLPVIHYRASKNHIQRVLHEAKYVCLGGLVPLARRKEKLRAWLDYLYGIPAMRCVKVHCLGIMSRWALERYPFYSADSSTALHVVRYPQQCLMKKMHQRTKNRFALLSVEIKKQLDLEKYITALWAKRGITWNE